MKPLSKIGLVFGTFGVMIITNELYAQSTTTVTSTTVQTSTGSLTEFVPASNIVVLGGDSSAPMRYSISKTTRIVDAGGNPIAVEKIPVGSPLSVEYEASGGQMVADRIVVQQALGAPDSVVERQQTTVTTTTRPMTEEEVEAREEAAEEQAEAREEMREEMEDARD